MSDSTRSTAPTRARMVFVLHGRRAISCRASSRASTRSASGSSTKRRSLRGPSTTRPTSLYAHRVRPRDALWLAADNLNALFWGLHDWAHFHNHGPFEQRAWTELQCDASALAWLWKNRARSASRSDAWERVRDEAVLLSRQRFAAEGGTFDEALLAAERLRGETAG